MTTYEVRDSRGQIHARTSTRIYRHAVVHHRPEQPADGTWAARPARSKAELDEPC